MKEIVDEAIVDKKCILYGEYVLEYYEVQRTYFRLENYHFEMFNVFYIFYVFNTYLTFSKNVKILNIIKEGQKTRRIMKIRNITLQIK